MRTAFINQLITEARTNPSIFLITGDLGYSVLEPFASEFPTRFLNAGVAEQNMTGIAAGLAKEGYKVFTYSIANFPTIRCLEQIRNDICYHNLDVTIVAVGGGYSYGSLGASHHATEDIGIMRTIPNLHIYAPGDPVETTLAVQQIAHDNAPGYLRLGKAGEPIVNKKPLTLDSLLVNCVISGANTAILSSGSILKFAFDNVINTPYSLYSFTKIKPFDISCLIPIANKYSRLITIEEHQSSCGFGSLILEALNDLLESNEIDCSPKIQRIAIPDKFTYISGNQEFLRDHVGLKFQFT